jgi:hypothetical protein
MSASQNPGGSSKTIVVIILIIVAIWWYNSSKKQSIPNTSYTPRSSSYSDYGETQRHNQAMQDTQQRAHEERRLQAIRNGDNPDLVSR